MKIIDVSREGDEIVIYLVNDEKTEAQEARLTEAAALNLIALLEKALAD